MFICGKINRLMAITPPPRPGGWSLDNMQSRHRAAQSGGIWGVNTAAPCQTQNQMITLINTEILREKRLNQQRGHGVKSVRKVCRRPRTLAKINRSLKRIRPQNVPKHDVVILLQKLSSGQPAAISFEGFQHFP